MDIREYLRSRRVPFETLLHAPAPSATRLAQSVHVPGGRVAKTVLVKTEGGYVLAVLPATHCVDLTRLAGLVGAREARIATEDEAVALFADCERGAWPPFGRLYGVRTIVDASLSGGAEIVVEGNTRHEGLRLRYRDFEAVEAPVRGRFASAVSPKRKKSSMSRR